MVELARARGVDARVGDVQALPFEDESFDAALAAWMLYHVPDVERGNRRTGTGTASRRSTRRGHEPR